MTSLSLWAGRTVTLIFQLNIILTLVLLNQYLSFFLKQSRFRSAGCLAERNHLCNLVEERITGNISQSVKLFWILTIGSGDVWRCLKIFLI